MSEENKKSILNWARKEARTEAIDNLHTQALTGIFDDNSRVAWDSMTKDQQAEFLDSKRLPSNEKFGNEVTGVSKNDAFEFSHLYSVSEYPEYAEEGSMGRLTTHLDHLYSDHGGDYQDTVHGSSRDPNFYDYYGTQEVDANESSGQDYLGMSGMEDTYQSRLDTELPNEDNEDINDFAEQLAIPPVDQELANNEFESLSGKEEASVETVTETGNEWSEPLVNSPSAEAQTPDVIVSEQTDSSTSTEAFETVTETANIDNSNDLGSDDGNSGGGYF